MQKILHFECPVIVSHVNYQYVAHRSGLFEGFVCNSRGAANFWTVLNAHLKESAGGPYGGNLRWAAGGDLGPNPLDPPWFPAQMTEIYWTTLMKKSSHGLAIPWLAEVCMVLTHEDNPVVPPGHMRIVFELFRNITWTDGMPLTAEDVAFSFNYHRDGAELGNPCARGLETLTAAYANGMYQVIIEFSRKSYWNLETAGYTYIIPNHVFAELGLEGFKTWTQSTPNDFVPTAGPLIVKTYDKNSRIILERNTDYFRSTPKQLSVETTTYNAPENSTIFTYMPSVRLFSSIGAVSVVVIAVAAMCKGRPTKQKYVFD
jgi:ABC-type transport system substrate-binding protein